MTRHDTRGLPRPDPGPELDTPSYQVLETPWQQHRTYDDVQNTRYTRAVLLQGGPRDAAVHFDAY